jgi:hypothetical protein
LVEDLQADKIKYAKDKISLYTVKENLTVLEERMKNQAWEHEILEQKTTRVFPLILDRIISNHNRGSFAEG